jgi:CRISPR-associated protein Cas1
MVRAENDAAIPIDFKRGKVPPVPRKAYDPERVQICVQALLLREAGYTCELGRLYFATSKTYVDVPIDAELVELTLAAIADARKLGVRSTIPPPLLDSPKCPRCSLNSICLPDETNAVRLHRESAPVRPFAAPSNDRVPLYVLEAGARVGLSGEVLEVRTDAGLQAEVRLMELASVSLFGAVQMSSQAMRNVLARDVPVFFLSYGGWLDGYARSVNDHSLDLRMAQHDLVKDADASLAIARSLVYGKVKNQRTMVRRARSDEAKGALQALALLLHKIERAASAEELLGLEGLAARRYFEQFGEMLALATGFEVTGRNRRPPTDPVNAMLSFGYAMLAKEALAAVLSVGFEPGLGIYHKVRPGRPSLALDLMEEFRPLIVDSVVLSLVNTKAIRVTDFDRRGRAVILTKDGRRTFIGAIERRLRSSIVHPIFAYEVSYRRALHIQARLLARVIQGDLPAYPAFVTR